jgi:hypothetical protein
LSAPLDAERCSQAIAHGDLMKTTVGWTLMFRVSTREGAEKALERANALLDHKLQLKKCERYWKIPELWTCDCVTVFDVPSVAEQIAGCLLLANPLAHDWQVLGPNLGPSGVLESLEGIFDHHHHRGKLQSLEWAQFQFLAPTSA